ncbi:MAG: DNA/RNA non-specific endonuclease [Muribaculaceae bacterium]|nr:DNA/RNA non-specific endonuclease [Muribaculaceae bacterium]
MKRFITIAIVALLALTPAVELATGLQGNTEWCATARTKTKSPKKAKKTKKNKKAKNTPSKGKVAKKSAKRGQKPTTVPRISSLSSTSVSTSGKSLLTVTVPQGNRRVDYKAITVYFNRSLRIPSCVAYELTNTMVSMADAPTAEKRKNHKFNPDPNVAGSPDWGDYRNSGYTRGHMAPAMDMRWDRQTMSECFLMTNMCPQVEKLNNGPWRHLEESVHRWAKRDGSIWVYTGPIMGGSVRHIGPKNDIAVPAAFYKVLYAPAQQRAIAFIYENKENQGGGLSAHTTTVAQVESRTGITFTGIPTAMKQKRDIDLWQ